MPVDGAPVTVTVNVTNTSGVVDGYVVEGLNAPPWLEVRPGTTELLPSTSGTVTADLRIVSSTLVPAQKLVLLVRLRNTTGRFAYRDMSVRVTVPVVEAPFQVRAEPQLIRARDHSAGVCTVVVENPRSNRWARVRLSAADPEQAVRTTWRLPELDVPPGGEARTDVRFEAPPPNPGSEVSRTITITAAEGQQRAETTVTLTQSASRAAIELLSLRLDPTVLRLGGRHRGQLTAVVDNRGGATPVSLVLRGDDPENSLGFAFSPATVQVPAGQQAAVRVTVTAPRTPPGQEVTRPLTIMASDGRSDTRVDGSVIQLASSRRGLARVLLTVLGGLAMILGSLLTFVADSENSAVELTAEEVSKEVDASHPEFGIPNDLDAMGVENVVSVGLVLIILAGLVIFGLTGRSGRLTRSPPCSAPSSWSSPSWARRRWPAAPDRPRAPYSPSPAASRATSAASSLAADGDGPQGPLSSEATRACSRRVAAAEPRSPIRSWTSASIAHAESRSGSSSVARRASGNASAGVRRRRLSCPAE